MATEPNLIGRLALSLRRRLPVVLQTEAAECGLACLAMVAGFHGHVVDLAILRRRFPMSLKGTTLASLVDVANRMKLSTRPVRLEIEHLKELRLPCVLHWNMNHFVVLKSVGARSVRIHDPASGERSVLMAEVSEAFTGVALEAWPGQEFKKVAETEPVSLRRLIGHVTGLFASLGQILLLALVLEIFGLVSPLFTQWVIDHAIVSGDLDLLTTLALGFGLLMLLEQTITAVRSWIIMHFGTTLNVQWRANVFTHMLRLPMPYFEKRHLGDIVSRFRSIDTIQGTLTSTFIESIIDGLMVVLVAVMIFLYNPLLSWLTMGAMLLYGISRWIWFRPLRMATQEQIIHAANQESHFLETVRGVRAIKLFQNQNERRSSWLTLVADQVNAGLRTQKLQILYRLINGLVFGAVNVLVIWLGAHAILDGDFTVGMFMAFMSYRGQFASRVSSLIDKYFQIKMLQIHGARLADIVLTEPEKMAEDGRLVTSESAALESRVRIRGLRFKYAEHEAFVLDGVDLEIEPGESVAIVGPSGCGKTTLLHVLLGILPPTDGDVAIGGTSLANLDPEVLRRTVATVTQNDTLFAGSVADNISFFDSQADQARVEECARLASIHTEIVAMPMGYNTFVGYLGSVLSGGQQQRVLLARALYRRPKILVLDEATSHLDVKREIMVSAAIRALNITRIIVAHRPQTAETADRILTLENGRIVDERRVSPNMTVMRPATLAAT